MLRRRGMFTYFHDHRAMLHTTKLVEQVAGRVQVSVPGPGTPPR